VLPLQGANFVLPATLVLKGRRGNVTGCEFKDLSAKNRRVLRRFIELAIDGQIDNVEDFIAAYSQPVIETPIEEALVLKKKGAERHRRTFLKKSMAYLFLGILAFAAIGYTAVYNLQYKISSTGVVTGTLLTVTANTSGVIDRIHVGVHEKVEKDFVLFEMIGVDPLPGAVPPAVSGGIRQVSVPGEPGPAFYVSPVIDELSARVASRHRQYRDARTLFDKRLITLKDYHKIYNGWLDARSRPSAAGFPDAHRPESRVRSRARRIRSSGSPGLPFRRLRTAALQRGERHRWIPADPRRRLPSPPVR
jgi:hypothetical protein